MTKNECINRLEVIFNASVQGSQDSIYKLTVKANDWKKYGKDRTYFSIVETSTASKHYVTKDYGYYDNINNEYVPGKNDLRENYTFGDMNFDEPAEEDVTEDTTTDAEDVTAEEKRIQRVINNRKSNNARRFEIGGREFNIGWQSDVEFSGPVFEIKKCGKWFGCGGVTDCSRELSFNSGVFADDIDIYAIEQAHRVLMAEYYF